MPSGRRKSVAALLSLAEGASTETNHRTYACHILQKAAAIEARKFIRLRVRI